MDISKTLSHFKTNFQCDHHEMKKTYTTSRKGEYTETSNKTYRLFEYTTNYVTNPRDFLRKTEVRRPPELSDKDGQNGHQYDTGQCGVDKKTLP